ncbi:unnamed protein product [Cuscuta epithymum]|uniref:Angiotensin-converting enzyme 2 n=1 Tax=Cuscuta epithymum TaxID=186058 RepID=A0AAV0F7W9_9ASTE|nr:unnamed protein product [Cuscuta epithymum]
MPSSQISPDSRNDNPNNTTEAPVADDGSISASGSDNRKVSREDIALVQNLIERCLQLYMDKDEVIKTLLNRARIDPSFTSLVWRKLEEENADFFQAYYIRLKLKKQIILFNQLLEQQYHLMKYPPILTSASLENSNNCSTATNLPMGYPIMQQPPIIPAASHSYVDPMMMSSCHVVNGMPALNNYHPMHMNSGNNMVIESDVAAAAVPQSNGYSSMIDTPASVPSSGHHFPFTALDTTFISDIVTTTGLQLPSDYCAGSYRNNTLRSLDHYPWNFNLSDLSEDLPNLEDIGGLGNHHQSSPFLHSDSDILLDSPEQEDSVEEFFVDFSSGPTCSQTDEKNPSHS